MATELKNAIDQLPGWFRAGLRTSDFRGVPLRVAQGLHRLLQTDSIIEAAKRNPIVSRRVGLDGLQLEEVDVSDSDVLGRLFSWKHLLAIDQDNSEKNLLKKELSRPGVYLQRSKNGMSGYVGSAYGEGGLLARWLGHLQNNGSAKHLNFFVLENGYSQIVFTDLEFTEDQKSSLSAESRWKQTLGTTNYGPYDGFRLNCN